METLRLERNLPVEKGYDLVVCGGGPAGFAAALRAARMGEKVLLLEGSGALGGMATMGLVNSYDCLADGEKCLVAGIQKEILDRLWERGEAAPNVKPDHWNERYLMPTKLMPEELKRTLDEMALEAGVTVRFFAKVVDALVAEDGKRLDGLVAHAVDGLRVIRAPVYIDCTGDAVLAKYAGVATREGLKDTGHVMPATLCFITGNADDTRADNPRKYADAALRDGHFTYPEVRFVPSRIGPGLTAWNAGHVYDLDATDPDALSEGIALGRQIVKEHVAYLRKYVPGYENCVLVSTAPLMGVRESRRIRGEYVLTQGDFLSARQFPDQIGLYIKEPDIHVYDPAPEVQARHMRWRGERKGWLPPRKPYGIPYGVLVPKGWKNLWVAGRTASTDQWVQSSSRVMPAASIMGEAAAVAARQCRLTGQTADALDTEALVLTLREQGAFLPQETLSKEMTRGTGWPEPDPLVGNPDDWTEEDEAAVREMVKNWPRPEAGRKPGAETTSGIAAGAAEAAPSAGDPLNPEGTFAQQARELLRHAGSRIRKDCCQSVLTDTDAFADTISSASLGGDGARSDAALDAFLEQTRDRLETGCCHSGFTDALELVDAIDRVRERGRVRH